MSARGYFGIGIHEGKSCDNVGGLWRSAHAFGAAFIFTVGFRPPRQPTDTTKAAKHVPLFEYATFDDLRATRPEGSSIIAVENEAPLGSVPLGLSGFSHPERAIYLLGSEDRGLPGDVLEACRAIVKIPTDYCLNVAVAGSIVLFDRQAKASS